MLAGILWAKIDFANRWLILSLDRNVCKAPTAFFFFSYYSTGMPLCPWLKFVPCSFLAVSNVAVVNLNMVLHPRGNCSVLVLCCLRIASGQYWSVSYSINL